MTDDSRALVLGAGGITGIAWEFGLLAGLARQGVDLSSAHLVIGTSAGAIVGAQLLAGVDLDRRYRSELDGANGERSARLGPLNLVRLGFAFQASDPTEARRRVGELALAAKTETEQQRRKTVASWLSDVDEWPSGGLQVTAVNAATGEFAVFDHSSGVDLVATVAGSCASPCVRPPSTIRGEQFIDGGMRSPSNADLAAGYGRVVVITPVQTGDESDTAKEVAALQEGSHVMHIAPDWVARPAVGKSMRQMLKPTRRPQAARAGMAQAQRVAAGVADVWSN